MLINPQFLDLKKLVFLFLFLSTLLYGQQVEQYSTGLLHNGLRNPAAIGTSGSLKAIGIVRQQWVSFSGAPSSQYSMIDLPLGVISGGLGVSFQQNLIGAHKLQRLKFGYSYQKSFGAKGLFAIGATGGMMMIEYDGTKLRTPDGQYGAGQFDHRDNFLRIVPFSGNTYTLDVGLYGEIDHLGVGISVINALAGEMSLDELSYVPERHIFGHIGYEFDVSGSIRIKSGVQVLSNKSALQGQAMLMGIWNEVYSLGVTYRGAGKISKESIGGIAGIQLNEHFQLFYSYEYNILPLRTVFDSSHEVAVVYLLNKQIGKGKLPKVIYNPRYF